MNKPHDVLRRGSSLSKLSVSIFCDILSFPPRGNAPIECVIEAVLRLFIT
mgnify:CR=1 FL=1